MSDNATIKNLLAETLCEPWRWDENDGYDGDAITRVWYEIPRDDLDGCVQWLEEKTSAGNDAASATVTNPMQGTRWHRSGTWYGGRVWLDWVERDGKRVLGLFQLLHRGSLTIPDVVTRNGCRYKAWTTWYHNLAEVGVLPANDPANGIEYERGPVLVDRDTGRVSYSVTKLQRLYQKISRYTTTVTAARTVRTAHHTGVKQGDLDDDGGSIGLQSMAASVPGKRLALRRTKDPECTQTIDESEEAVNDQTIVDRERTFRAHTDRTIHTQADVALGAPAEQQHHLHRHVSEETEFGRYRTTDEDVTVQDQVITEQGRTARAHTERTIHTEADAALAAPVEEQHHLHRHVSEETEAGGFRTTDEDVTVQDQAIVEQLRSADRHVDRTIHTEADAALGAPSEEQHHIHRHVSEETEAGGYRTTDEDIEVQNRFISEEHYSARSYWLQETNTEEDAALSTPVADPGQHFVARQSSEETEAGGWRNTYRLDRLWDQTHTEQVRSARAHTDRTIHTEADAALAAPVEQQHHIHRHVSEETEAGGYRTTDEDVEVQDQLTTEVERSPSRHGARTIHSEADVPLAAPVEAVGHIRRNISEETEAGGWRTIELDIEPQDQTATNWRKVADVSTSETVHTEGAALTEPATPGEGTIVERRSEPTESGQARTVDQEQTSTENWYPSATTDLPYEGRYGTCYLRMGFNVRSTNLQARIQAFALAHVGMSVSPSVYRQSDRTWTVTLTARAVSGGGGGSDWWDNGTEQYTYTNDDGLSVTVQVLWTTARDKAFSWCNGATLYSMAPPAGQDRIGHDSGNITKPYFMGSSRFKAVRVYRATA